MGKKPIPTADKIAKGTFRPDRHITDEVVYNLVPRETKTPEILRDEGREEWERVFPQVYGRGVFNETDMSVLLAYCIEIQRYFQAQRNINEKGLFTTITNKGGGTYLVENPAVKVASKSIAAALRIATEFGFTPSSRTKISVGQARAKEDPDAQMLHKLVGS